MSEGGVNTVTTGNGLPGCSSRDMICGYPLAKHMSKIEFMPHNKVVSRYSQTNFSHRETTIVFKGNLKRRHILNIIDVGINCLANGNPVTDCKKKLSEQLKPHRCMMAVVEHSEWSDLCKHL